MGTHSGIDRSSGGQRVTITMYGIKNCDTIKKARTWLEGQGIGYAFHDYKQSGIDADTLRQWADEHGWEVILNRAGTTFRALPDEDKQDIDADKAIAQLPPGYKMVFTLHDIEGHEHEEIARMLGCSVGTSKSQLHKARMKLRGLLRQQNKPKQQPRSGPPD